MKTSDPTWASIPNPHRRLGRRGSGEVSGIVQHFTAGGSGRAVAKWMAGPDSAVSAHIVICRNGDVIQQVEFENEAFHAGEVNSKGYWQGARQTENANHFTIGIENSNYGWLIHDETGFWCKRKVKHGWEKTHRYEGPDPVRLHDHMNVQRWWEPYPQRLIDSNIEVCKRIVELYPAVTAERITRHSDISPHRKFDPGPAFPHARVIGEVFDYAAVGSVLGIVYAGGEDPEDESVHARDYYDEDLEMCIEPGMTIQ